MLKNIPEEDVLAVVKKQGPTIPARIVKELGGDTFLIGAILSNLSNKGAVKVTTVKIGGTPFYYVPEDGPRLVELKKNLNEKDLRTYELLQKEKILKDDEQTPLVRVSLRNIKDYAIPIDVSRGDDPVLYWKFYTMDNKDVQALLREKIGKKEITKPKPVLEEEEEKEEVKIKEELEKPVAKKEKVKQEKEIERVPEKKIVKEEKRKVIAEEKEIKEQKPVKETQEKITEEEPAVKKETKKEKTATKEGKQDFIGSVQNHFKSKNIEVVETSIIRKGEIDFVIKIPSPIGVMEYFCKARDKKKISDGDIATAFIQGQQKKLPVLFLTNGELTKRTKEMLNKEFKGVLVNNI